MGIHSNIQTGGCVTGGGGGGGGGSPLNLAFKNIYNRTKYNSDTTLWLLLCIKS